MLFWRYAGRMRTLSGYTKEDGCQRTSSPERGKSALMVKVFMESPYQSRFVQWNSGEKSTRLRLGWKPCTRDSNGAILNFHLTVRLGTLNMAKIKVQLEAPLSCARQSTTGNKKVQPNLILIWLRRSLWWRSLVPHPAPRWLYWIFP